MAEPVLCPMCGDFHHGPCPLATGGSTSKAVDGKNCGRCGTELPQGHLDRIERGEHTLCPVCQQPL